MRKWEILCQVLPSWYVSRRKEFFERNKWATNFEQVLHKFNQNSMAISYKSTVFFHESLGIFWLWRASSIVTDSGSLR